MLINFIKTTFRYLIKRKTYSLINIVGLAIGIASFIMIMIYVIDEVNYDRHHQQAADHRLVKPLCQQYTTQLFDFSDSSFDSHVPGINDYDFESLAGVKIKSY